MQIFLFLSAVLFLAKAENDVNFKFEDLPSGVFFHSIGTAYVEKGTFEFLRVYTKQELLHNRETLQNIKKYIESTETEYPLHEFLKKTIDNFDLLLFLCDNNSKSLKKSLKRTKRGFFGWILTKIFGVNDEAYQQIAELQKENIDLYNYTNSYNSLMEKKIQETQSVLSVKVKQVLSAIKEQKENTEALLNETKKEDMEIEHIKKKTYETKLFKIIEELSSISYNIIKAVNGKSVFVDHFSFGEVKKTIEDANEILNNTVSENIIIS